MNSTDLVLPEKMTALQIFSEKGGLNSIIQDVRDLVDGFEHDMSTGAGRDRTRAFAAKIPKLKVVVDGMGKDLVAEWKSNAGKVDASRRSMRNDLDALNVEARLPLTEYEAEKARAKAEEAKRLEAERLAAEIDQAHEVGLLIDKERDRDIAEEAARIAQDQETERARLATEQKAREEKIKTDAENRSRIKTEEAAQAKIDLANTNRIESERREQAAIDAAAESERLRLAGIEQAAQQRIIDAENAQRQADAAAQAVIDQQAADLRAEQEATRKREANTVHKKAINNSAVSCIINASGITEDQAKAIVTAIARRQISNVTISY